MNIKTFDDIIYQSVNGAITFWNLDLGIHLTDAEHTKEIITCCALIKEKYLDSIKNIVKHDKELCIMLEKDGIKIQ